MHTHIKVHADIWYCMCKLMRVCNVSTSNMNIYMMFVPRTVINVEKFPELTVTTTSLAWF